MPKNQILRYRKGKSNSKRSRERIEILKIIRSSGELNETQLVGLFLILDSLLWKEVEGGVVCCFEDQWSVVPPL